MPYQNESISLSKPIYYGMLCQVLELIEESGSVSAQLNEVHHQSPVPAVPIYRGVCSAGDAALWGTVSTRVTSLYLFNVLFIFIFAQLYVSQ